MKGLTLLDWVASLSTPVLWFVFVFILWKTGVPNRIRRLYPRRVQMLSALPFTARWQHEVAPEHVDAFRKSRRGFCVGLTAILVVSLLTAMYFKLFFLRLHGIDMKSISLHVEYSTLRPINDADKARATRLAADLQHALAKYQDYHVAEADGFQPSNPEFKLPVVEFMKNRHSPKAAFAFDPSQPDFLLYQRTAHGGYKLVGATYTDRKDTGEDQLNARIPLSVVRWHRFINECFPARGADGKTTDWTKFGITGSIATKQACDAAGGRFLPRLSGWIVQVHSWETDPKLVWAQ